jgi:chemotaxis protein MotA
MFVSDHAIIIIFGGSFAATLIRFPLSSIFHGEVEPEPVPA